MTEYVATFAQQSPVMVVTKEFFSDWSVLEGLSWTVGITQLLHEVTDQDLF